jgi:zinc/manganese transport system substrate-binding protein/manganese/iron transport system substrate-binding protein
MTELLARGPTRPIAALSALVLSLVLIACSGGASDGSAAPTAEPEALRVVATTTVFADLVGQVGGSHVVVTSLVPMGGEVHTFDPSPSDVVRVAEAQLVVMNGVGLDDWLADVVADAGSTAPILELAEGLDGVDYLKGDADEGEAVNPHLWLDVSHARRYAARIGEALAETDPDHAGDYRSAAAAYDARLGELDTEIRSRIGELPEANRRIVSFHEAFPYFAAAYGLEIVGVIVDAPGQDPSAGEIAELVGAIRASGAKAVFTEAQFSPDVAQTVATEAGIAVVRDLHTDSLGDTPATTYLAMMRSNTDKVVEALR